MEAAVLGGQALAEVDKVVPHAVPVHVRLGPELVLEPVGSLAEGRVGRRRGGDDGTGELAWDPAYRLGRYIQWVRRWRGVDGSLCVGTGCCVHGAYGAGGSW